MIFMSSAVFSPGHAAQATDTFITAVGAQTIPHD